MLRLLAEPGPHGVKEFRGDAWGDAFFFVKEQILPPPLQLESRIGML